MAMMLQSRIPVEQLPQIILVTVFVLAAVVDLVARMRRGASTPAPADEQPDYELFDEAPPEREPIGELPRDWRREPVRDTFREQVTEPLREQIKSVPKRVTALRSLPARAADSTGKRAKPRVASIAVAERRGAGHLDISALRAELADPRALQRSVVLLTVLGPCRAIEEHRG
jgi:hypothetical protein